VAKKHVRSAVDRNQVKRIAREVFRIQPGGAVPLDVVVLARRGIDQLNKQQLMTILRQQWLKLSSHASSLESGNDRGR
jgi:ribonuclease P protein component